MRFLYSLLVLLLLPVVLLVFWAKGFGKNLRERLGKLEPAVTGAIWLHAASVGEVNAAVPLIKELRSRYSGCPLLITTFTPTGAQRARELTRGEVPVHFLPLDAGFAVRRFLKAVQPKSLIVMETEIWPNLFLECARRNIPVSMVSARLSEKSVRGYQRFGGFIAQVLAKVRIAAQTDKDKHRFEAIGADHTRIEVTGNLKLAFEMPENALIEGRAVREKHAQNRPLWIAASTHEGEEEQVLEAHRLLLEKHPNLLLLLVPRHPQRFDGVAELIRRADLSFIRRSSNQVCDRRTKVLLGDTMGELLTFFAASDIAFVGGSLGDVGGHNLLEPAAVALPLVTGPNNTNAQEMADLMESAGALEIVHNGQELAAAVSELLTDEKKRTRMGAAALKTMTDHGATLDRLMKLVGPTIAHCRRRSKDR